MKIIFFVFALALTTMINAQEVSKELGKLDGFTSTANLDNFAKTHYDQNAKEHEAKLADLRKAGVVIIGSDTVMSVDKPVKIAFSWPVSYGQKLADKSNEKRDPQVMTLFPAKDPANKDIAQKWQVNVKDGSVKTVQ